MLFADKLGMPKKIKDLAESLDLEVTNHHDPEFDAKREIKSLYCCI